MITYRALLHRFQLTCDEPIVDGYLREVLSPLQEASEAAGRVTHYQLVRNEASSVVDRLLLDGEFSPTSARTAGPIGRFLQLVDRAAERVTAEWFPVLHAAACHLDGRTIVLPGAPDAGKSTLMAHLASSGWTYLSDELVAIMPGDPPRILAYPRSIVLDEGSWSLFHGRMQHMPLELAMQFPHRRHLVPTEESRPHSGASYPITDVAVYRWKRGAPEQVTELDAVDCLRCLLGASFSVERSPQRDLDTLAHVVDHAACRRLEGGRLDHVQRLLGGPPTVR